jgi:RimJ/RimL family protein N-acetyltransferase
MKMAEHLLHLHQKINPHIFLQLLLMEKRLVELVFIRKRILCKKNAELGYWLGEVYWRHGIVSRAIVLMLKFAFDTYDITRVYARPFGTNIGSQKVLEKLGFQLEARIKNNIFKNGQFDDELIYGFRKEDLQKL